MPDKIMFDKKNEEKFIINETKITEDAIRRNLNKTENGEENGSKQ